VALDRQSIEKRDFPIGRRGYDPDAVDAHLALLADEVEGLKRAGRQRGGETLASAASEQVRLIVEAAEQSAGDIEREADLEARRIRQEAREAAEKLRSEAGSQARDHVTRVSEAASSMLERIDAIDSEVRTLIDSLRSGANRVSADLALLQGSVGELRGGGGGATFEPESGGGAPAAAAVGASAEPAVAATDFDDADVDDEPFEDEADDIDEVPEATVNGTASDDRDDDDRPADEEGARLIALNMALNGTPREETEQYLQENFDLPDADALLDDVYARAGQ
jgi:DivIVA domain-containing protein